MLNRGLIAVLGTGLAGLTCARSLRRSGFQVVLIDKGRSVAGRMSVRRVAELPSAPEVQFDHGAQYFTARNPEFIEQVERWHWAGVVARWEGPFVRLNRGQIEADPGQGDPRYVGVPGMNAICRLMAEGLSVHCGIRITGMQQSAKGWQLQGEWNRATEEVDLSCLEQTFDAVVVTFPAPQTAAVLPHTVNFRDVIQQVQMSPCRCLMMELAPPLTVDFNAAFVQDSPLRWIARENSKPGRESRRERWVLHAAPDWSQETVERSESQLISTLLRAFSEAIAQPLPEVLQLSTHRWRFAIPDNPLNLGCLSDPEQKLVAAGDWCAEARVEGAYLSGLQAAKAVKQMLS